MASSSKSRGPYHVFLSFRGADVRNNFVGHLYSALVQNGIRTFRDSEELWKGDNISMLMEAIKESCIAVIVFSENYAFSWWCLEEVAKIMELNEQKVLTVRPVFYKVDPKEVRKGRASYAKGLAKHESKHGKNSNEMKKWKKALLDAGSLSGWTLNDRDDESKVIQKIVKDISTCISQTPLDVAEHLVGIESRVAEVKSMLNLESKDDVLTVGLWGQGGLGKTTLGKVIFNDVFRQFEGSSFLENVRENSKGGKGLVTLQEQLLKETLLLSKILKVPNVARGQTLIADRLRHKRVLVILDDVDDEDQLRALVGKANWFGCGSRILVTTRDKHLLTCTKDNCYMYEVEALGITEARELLCKHAFPHQKSKIRECLVKGVLDHANGLPLALEVLGSFLRDRREHEWKSTLERLSKIPMKGINDVLKISYDGLEENEREIFLDIACFFKGWEFCHVKKVLDSCGLEAEIGLQILIERSLIRAKRGNIQMHDLIQLMGKYIVNQGLDDPAKRSRLWSCDDVANVLSRDVGDCAIKSIVLEPPEAIEICIGPDAFTKMIRLRLLILRNVRDSFQGPIYLPSELRWFEWPGCARRIPEFSGPKKLVGLDMGEGNVAGVVIQFKDFQQLKYITFSFCESLVRIPDLSCTPYLEKLVIRNCENMIEAHESIAYHEKLEVLILEGCSQLSVFPTVLKSKNLQRLRLANCKKFETFPDIPCELEGLKWIDLNETAIKELPASIENLVSLEEMYIRDCKNLVSLPSSIYKLQNMKKLEIQECTALIGFPKYEDSADPSIETGLSSLRYLELVGCNLSEVEFLENLSCFPLLKYLYLSGNNITFLPTSINRRDHLSDLTVGDCHQLQEIPQFPPCLDRFWAINCESLQHTEDCISPHAFIHRALNMRSQDKAHRGYICIPGGEMPEWFLPIEEGSVSFEASKDLWDKFFGLALCVVLNEQHEQPLTPQFDTLNGAAIFSSVNGQLGFNVGRLGNLSDPYHYPLHSDHLWFLLPDPFRPLNFDRSDGSYVQFRISVWGKWVKKWGMRILCKQLDNVLKVEIQDNPLIDPALLYEVDHDSTGSEAQSSHEHENSPIETDLHEDLQDYQLRADEQNRTGSGRNQKLFSLQAWERGPRGLLIQLAEMTIAAFARCFCC